ncbi:MAG: hypothetical protein M1817_004444 [Caeruleum heppii]|nr:MAG: hypothetical protein M1817_004444 [Caeruleum heppii]
MFAGAAAGTPSKPGGGIKRSLFKKPAWSNAQPAESGADLFSRSKDSYSDIIKEQDDLRKRRDARRQRENERQGLASGTGAEQRSVKRQRLSVESDEEEGSSSDGEDGSEEDDNNLTAKRRKQAIALRDEEDDEGQPPSPPPDDGDLSPVGQSKAKRFDFAIDEEDDGDAAASGPPPPIPLSDDEEAGSPRNTHACDDDDDDDDDVIPLKSSNPPITVDDDAPPEDEEFPELARKARERARLKQLDIERGTASNRSSAPLDDHTPSVHQDPSTETIPVPDARINILITSRMPNTKPLVVQRKVSQRLKDVRIAWCGKQGLDQDTTADVLLTWRGKRVFDVTSCKSLGIGVDRAGNVVLPGQRDLLGEENRQIHMEAMTEETFSEMRRRKEAGQEPEETPRKPDEVEEPPEPAQEQIRIILRSRGYQDHKLIVRPVTTLSRIVEAFRQARQVSSDNEVFLVFDGERLPPEDVMSDTEIGDMEIIDVQVK